MLDIALEYILEGWSVVPIIYREKRPSLQEWQTLRLNSGDAPKYFNGHDQNIGVILGDASKGLTDIDLDCDEAWRASPFLLPKTHCFGRASKPYSHWLYYTDLAHTAEKATLQWKEGTKPLLECRVGATGAQTVFPGSTHPSGERVEWADQNNVTRVDGVDLVRRCARLSAACLLARHFPGEGGRHNAGLVIGGFLAKCGFSAPEGKLFASAVCAATLQSPDVARDIERAVSDAILKAESGGARSFGYPALKAMFGNEAAKKCALWLDFKGEIEAPPSVPDFSSVPFDSYVPPYDETTKPVPVNIHATPFVWVDPVSIPRRQWLYGKHYVRKFISETVAPGAYGKSTLALTEALAIVTGRDLLGVIPDERANVWVWNGEDPMEELQRRIAATCSRYEIDPTEIAGRLFIDTGRETRIIIAEQKRDGPTISRPVVDAVVDSIRINEIALMIVDPFVSSHRVVENDNPAIELVVDAWAEIADITGCAIELIHHSRKTNGAEITVEDSRGGSALLAKVRSARTLNGMSEADAEKSGIEKNKRRGYFRLENGKANLTAPPDKSDWYHIEPFDLGNGGSGYPGDSVGIITRWEWPDPFAFVTVADLRRVQAAISVGRWRENSQSKDWAGHAVAEALNLDTANKAHRAKIAALLKTWISAGMFVVVEGLDGDRHLRSFIEVGTPCDV
jgi:hypothetical protein